MKRKIEFGLCRVRIQNALKYIEFLPENTYLLTTLETNRDIGYGEISKAPKPSQRYNDFLGLE